MLLCNHWNRMSWHRRNTSSGKRIVSLMVREHVCELWCTCKPCFDQSVFDAATCCVRDANESCTSYCRWIPLLVHLYIVLGYLNIWGINVIMTTTSAYNESKVTCRWKHPPNIYNARQSYFLWRGRAGGIVSEPFLMRAVWGLDHTTYSTPY